ncbi:hypothetical protein EPUS_03581 [Endocarpon pusillum Z07020]|uniref:Uncharacterized protein n=1 Tax=Endocarpon pusillum (strain Z07020 / HMAS-L-300199) TaxID=1263415 RepID=U1HM01_ENDPU|nr:uncharacterized protein EPUS_03581 [Endocarpon pusillum Z07020]ERF70029.1 hypothetical protein EPUS_03581 [Endocarpon pusillum Z07020]
MCIFTDYLYACNHRFAKHSFCTHPCANSEDFHGHGLSKINPMSSSQNCPDKQTKEIVFRFACPKCCKKHSKDPDTAPIFINDELWQLSEVRSRGEQLCTIDSWVESSSYDESWGKRSVSPKGRSGSGARTLKNVARNVLGRVKKTLLRDREPDDGFTEKEIEELFVEDPRREGRRPLQASMGSASLGTKVIKGDR